LVYGTWLMIGALSTAEAPGRVGFDCPDVVGRGPHWVDINAQPEIPARI
jgi:hypothetical protein